MWITHCRSNCFAVTTFFVLLHGVSEHKQTRGIWSAADVTNLSKYVRLITEELTNSKAPQFINLILEFDKNGVIFRSCFASDRHSLLVQQHCNHQRYITTINHYDIAQTLIMEQKSNLWLQKAQLHVGFVTLVQLQFFRIDHYRPEKKKMLIRFTFLPKKYITISCDAISHKNPDHVSVYSRWCRLKLIYGLWRLNIKCN